MPLDTRKAQHLIQVLTRSFAGRQRTLVIVSLASGSYSYTTVQAIMRPLHNVNPQIYDENGQAAPQRADTLLIAPLTTNLVGAVYIADTPNIGSIATAPKYEIIEALPGGILPTGTHLRVQLRRLR